VVELCQKPLPENMGIPADQIQVLTPTRRGSAGTLNLNRLLQQALNPRRPERGSCLGRAAVPGGGPGDADPQRLRRGLGTGRRHGGHGMFNGDVGRIVQIDPEGELADHQF
jgi:exodeoxyribonuclease V alpha subunit